MVCDICGKSGVRQRYVSRSYGKGASLLVIEGVPVMSCPHCGESYLTAQTLHEVERIKREREGIATKRTVAVEFDQGKLFNPEGLWDQTEPITARDIAEVRKEMWHKFDQKD